MPRAPDGTYTPPLPDVAPGDVVSSAWANTTVADISQALTDSLDRNGNGGMNVTFPFGDGNVAAPGIAWEQEPSTGFYRAATGDMRVAVLGNDLFRWQGGLAQVWTGSAWAAVLYQGVAGTVPDGSVEGQTLRWDNAGGAWQVTEALKISAAGNAVVGNLLLVPDGAATDPSLTFSADLDTGLYRIADNVLGFAIAGAEAMRLDASLLTVAGGLSLLGAIFGVTTLDMSGNLTVGGTVDGRDVAGDGAALDSHIADSNIHFTIGSIPHGSIQDVGSNTHAQIDSHIGNASIHFADSGSATPQARNTSGWVNSVKVTNDAGAAQAQPTDLQVLTQAEYDGITPQAGTLYYIVG